MLNVTKAATDYLNDVLVRADAPEESAVRIVPRPEGDGLVTTIDQERAGDQHFDCDGRTVLVLDPQIATQLSDLTLDVGESEGGKKLVCLS